MAVTNPEAVRFCNEQVRPTADLFEQLYWTAKHILLNWNAAGVAALVPNDSTAIDDGALTDGRKPITGAMVNNIINRAFEFVTDQEAGGNGKINTIIGVSVNGQARF